MLPEYEQAVFEEIVAGIGPIDVPEPRDYLAPWWVPPAVLMFYGLMLTVAAMLYTVPVLGGAGFLAQVVAIAWAVHRRRHRSGRPVDLWQTRPFIS